MDFYSASGIPILWCCFFQTIAIGWIFGVEKFALCVEQMTGYKPNYYWILTWSIIAPLVMAVRQKLILSLHSNYRYIIYLFWIFYFFLAGFHFVFYFVDSSKIRRSWISNVCSHYWIWTVFSLYAMDSRLCLILYLYAKRKFERCKYNVHIHLIFFQIKKLDIIIFILQRFVKGITPNIISKRSTAPPKSVVKEMQMSESSARLLKNASFLTKNSSFTAENP